MSEQKPGFEMLNSIGSFHVVFFAEDPRTLSSTVWFLERRGWTVKVFSSFGDLLIYCSAFPPRFIFVSFTGENNEVVNYPASLQNKLKLPVVAFGETTDNTTIRRLRSHQGESIMPPISGHTIFSKLQSEHTDVKQNISVNAKLTGPDQTSMVVTSHKFEIDQNAEKNVNAKLLEQSQISLSENRNYTENEQVLFQDLGKTFQNACEAAIEKHVPITNTQKLTVIPITSDSVSGLLVMVMAGREEVDAALVENLRTKMGDMGSYVQFNGLSTKTLHLEVDEVDFKAWTSHKAKYVTRGNHKGKEVMMAFFEMEKSMIRVIPSPDPTMSEIKIDNLTSETRIEFDAYLYLHSNQKFLKYLRGGCKVSDSQLKNLKKKNIESLHIKNEVQDNYRAYVAKNHLNSTMTSSNSYLNSNIKKAA
ncbi:MAG: hypothetical protein SGJ18_05715 [Pseudomonadota bacterium]|nr:hypothetical protein [Pseudomonadota bacterium]